MDIVKPSGPDDLGTYPWKTIVICVAIGQFLIEGYVNWRQLRILRRQSLPTLYKDIWNGQIVVGSREWAITAVRFRIWNLFYSMIQAIALITLNAVPKLWTFVLKVQTTTSFVYLSEDFNRSLLFLVCYYSGLVVINLPIYSYRRRVLKEENTCSNFYMHKSRNWAHDIAKGRPVPAVLMLLGLIVMVCQLLGKAVGRWTVVLFALAQAAFTFLYPILTQPRPKTLSSLGPGGTKDAIEELATKTGFPLKNIYITDDSESLQVFGWPKKKHITVPKTMIEDYNNEDIVALAAQAVGHWKYSNGIKTLMMGQLHFNQTFLYLWLFMKAHNVYEALGFEGQYPMVAGIILSVICICPPLTGVIRFQGDWVARQNEFMADRYAADLGYSSDLSRVLIKTPPGNDQTEDVDWLYSTYYNMTPTISERLAGLKAREEKDAKDRVLISLTQDEKR